MSRLDGGAETNVSYHVGDSPTDPRVTASSADMQPSDADQSFYVNAVDLDPTLSDFDTIRTVASKASESGRSSGYQSVGGSSTSSVWDVMSFDNPLFRAFSLRPGSGRRQLISPTASPGPSNQSTV